MATPSPSKLHQKSVYEILGRHPIHPFPARMAPGIALDFLPEQGEPLRVLDPMIGSGTVLAVARARGHRGYGYDIDPLAVMLAAVWTRALVPSRVRCAAQEVLSDAQVRMRTLSTKHAYPAGSDEETRAFVRYWFDPLARRQLSSLAASIAAYPERRVREALWCGFSRLIITKQAGASRAMDLAHSRPHRAFSTPPVRPFHKFLEATERIVAGCPVVGGKTGPRPRIRLGDARALRLLPECMDVVITSPPYLNAIDYLRCSKFTLVWLGYSAESLREIRSASVGSEAGGRATLEKYCADEAVAKLECFGQLPHRQGAQLVRYSRDIHATVGEAARVLRPGGRAVFVIGDSVVRNVFVRNSLLLTHAAAHAGLSLEARRERELPTNKRYLPPPSPSSSSAPLDGRMRREVVLVFRKPNGRRSRRARRGA